MPEATRWQLIKNKMKKSLKVKLQSLSNEEMESYVGGDAKTVTLPTVIVRPPRRQE